MSVEELVASEFKDKSDDAILVFQGLRDQYRDLIRIPYYRDKELGRSRGSIWKSLRKEAFKVYLNSKHFCVILQRAKLYRAKRNSALTIKAGKKSSFQVTLQNADDGKIAVVPFDLIIAALQLCHDKEWRVPFDLKVVQRAAAAFESLEPSAIYESSLEIEQQTKRFELAAKNEQAIVSSTNDERNKWLREQKAENRLTIKQIRALLKKSHPEWDSLDNDSSVNTAIKSYEKRRSLSPLPKRKHSKKQ